MNDIDKKRIKGKISSSPKVQILHILIVKCCEILKKQILPVFSNLFQIMKKYGKPPNLLYEARMTMTKFCMFFIFLKM